MFKVIRQEKKEYGPIDSSLLGRWLYLALVVLAIMAASLAAPLSGQSRT
jgi:hypothetical protein